MCTVRGEDERARGESECAMRAEAPVLYTIVYAKKNMFFDVFDKCFAGVKFFIYARWA